MIINNTSKRSLSNNSGRHRGKIIGQYSIGDKIGEGTFSKVCLGTHLPTGERVRNKY
jgi:hypothetical protein